MAAALCLGGCNDDTSEAPEEQPATPADRMVDAADARIDRVLIAPDNPDVRLVVWAVGDDRAIAVTDDAFETRATLISGGIATYAGHDTFVIFDESGTSLLHADGTTTPIQSSGPAAPASPDDILARDDHATLLAVNPETGAGHPAAVPKGLTVVKVGSDGTYIGLIRDIPAFSSDGGRTWQRVAVAAKQALLVPVEMLPDGPIALLGGAKNQEIPLPPLEKAYRSSDGGSTFEEFDVLPELPIAFGRGAVLPDGRLLLSVRTWADSDSPIAGPHPRPIGLYVSRGDDWSAYDQVPMTDIRRVSPTELIATADGTLVVSIPLTGDPEVSTNGGQTWSTLAAR